jgi:alpha-D-xyloside xylohydrolase
LHPDDIYMFGDDLLVAPVVVEGARQKEVMFPPGRWIDWWDGSTHPGGWTETIDAPLEKLPLYLRQGGIVPLLRPTIDTLAPTTKPEQVDSYATDPGVLYARVATGLEKTQFTLFDGTLLGQQETTAGITLEVVGGQTFDRGVCFELLAFGPTKPFQVMDGSGALAQMPDLAALEAQESGWFYEDARSGALWVKVGPGGHTVQVRHR